MNLIINYGSHRVTASCPCSLSLSFSLSLTRRSFFFQLLGPVKAKYGIGLSWGDLIVLAGNVAIESMGGPVLGFAAGRIDHVDNSQSIGLGPSEEQDMFHHITVDGAAEAPLGQNTMGLIYVNPQGPMGEPDPQKAADTIRDVFGRMGMDDRENVALIGGGHTVRIVFRGSISVVIYPPLTRL
jgi:catalase (peroxidase I)